MKPKKSIIPRKVYTMTDSFEFSPHITIVQSFKESKNKQTL